MSGLAHNTSQRGSHPWLRVVLLLAAALLLALAAAAPAWALGNEVVTWGADTDGELGLGPASGPAEPVPHRVCAINGCIGGYLHEVLKVSAGGSHTLALLANHEVVAWGSAESGALGNGTTSPNLGYPVKVCAPGATPVTSAPCPSGPYLEHVAAIAAGDSGSNIALLEDGEVVTWGSNSAGQLGAGYTPATKYSSRPVYVCEVKFPMTTCSASERLKGISAVSQAPAHAAAIMQPGGELLTWGVNEVGQLGQGDYNQYNDVPQHVCEVEYEPIAWNVPDDSEPACPRFNWLTGVEAITFGLEHNIATFSGEYLTRIWSEGSETELEIEEDKYTKAKKPPKEKPRRPEGKPEEIEGYASHSVVAFGQDEEGQLGTGVATSTPPHYSAGEGGPQKCNLGRACAQVPMHVCKPEVGTIGRKRCGFGEYLEPVTSISAGGSHSLARQELGEVLSWGENAWGTVGDGPKPEDTCSFTGKSCSPVPWHVCNIVCTSPLTEHLTHIKEISGGTHHDLALSESGEVLSWGSNEEGQRGNAPIGGFTSKPGYVCAKETAGCTGHLSEVTQISAGSTHNAAIVQCRMLIWVRSAKSELPFADIELPYIYYFRTNCNEVRPWEWHIGTGTLPEGLALNTETGEITGKPTTPGTSTFTIEVTNAEKETASATVSLTVVSPPDIGRCVTVPAEGAAGYTFSDKGCTKPVEGTTGKYEWLPGGLEKPAFTLTTKGSVTLETLRKSKLLCTTASGSGEYTEDGVSDVVLRMAGCESQGRRCRSAEAGEGEVVTEELEGTLGWEAQAKRRAALDLYPVAHGRRFAQYTCEGAATSTIEGSVLVPVKAGKMTASQSLAFKGSKGKQKPEAFEGGEPDVLITSTGEEAGAQTALSTAATLTGEEAVEINTST